MSGETETCQAQAGILAAVQPESARLAAGAKGWHPPCDDITLSPASVPRALAMHARKVKRRMHLMSLNESLLRPDFGTKANGTVSQHLLQHLIQFNLAGNFRCNCNSAIHVDGVAEHEISYTRQDMTGNPPVGKAFGEVPTRHAGQIRLLEQDSLAAIQQPDLWHFVPYLHYLASCILFIACSVAAQERHGLNATACSRASAPINDADLHDIYGAVGYPCARNVEGDIYTFVCDEPNPMVKVDLLLVRHQVKFKVVSFLSSSVECRLNSSRDCTCMLVGHDV